MDKRLYSRILASDYLTLFQPVKRSTINTWTTALPQYEDYLQRTTLPLMNILIDKSHQSAERQCAGGQTGMFMVMVNCWWSCMQASKDTTARQGNFVLLQSSSPDVRREGGGGKTNISLMESSEDRALGSKTSARHRQNTKCWKGRRKWLKNKLLVGAS